VSSLGERYFSEILGLLKKMQLTAKSNVDLTTVEQALLDVKDATTPLSTKLNAIEVAVVASDLKLADLKTYTDGLETSSSALEATATALQSSSEAIETAVGDLETVLSALSAKIDDIRIITAEETQFVNSTGTETITMSLNDGAKLLGAAVYCLASKDLTVDSITIVYPEFGLSAYPVKPTLEIQGSQAVATGGSYFFDFTSDGGYILPDDAYVEFDVSNGSNAVYGFAIFYQTL
jgi:hypothetical protein